MGGPEIGVQGGRMRGLMWDVEETAMLAQAEGGAA